MVDYEQSLKMDTSGALPWIECTNLPMDAGERVKKENAFLHTMGREPLTSLSMTVTHKHTSYLANILDLLDS